MKKVKVQVSRKFVPHSMLLSAAGRAIAKAKTKEDGYWWDLLSATLYCSLSIEAIGNTYGETFITRWSDFESSSPLAKMRIVAEHCRIEPDFSCEPWSCVSQLIKFRNKIAHANMETIEKESIHDFEGYEKYLYTQPQSKLEKMVSEQFALKCYDNIYDILQLLADNLPEDAVMNIEYGDWSGGSTIINEG